MPDKLGARPFGVIGGGPLRRLGRSRLVLGRQQFPANVCAEPLLEEGERLALVIAVGYGKTQGTAHVNRPRSEVSEAPLNAPSWYLQGIEGALLAPTALNQQKFKFTLSDGNKVKAEAGRGFYAKIDLGIARYQFELFAGKENFEWIK